MNVEVFGLLSGVSLTGALVLLRRPEAREDVFLLLVWGAVLGAAALVGGPTIVF